MLLEVELISMRIVKNIKGKIKRNRKLWTPSLTTDLDEDAIMYIILRSVIMLAVTAFIGTY